MHGLLLLFPIFYFVKRIFVAFGIVCSLLFYVIVFTAPAEASNLVNHFVNGRTYLSYSPSNVVPSGSKVFIFMHGSGGTAEESAANSGFNSLADVQGFVMVYPQGSGSSADWNGGGCCGSAVTDQVDDVGFISNVISEVKNAYSTDKVYVLGYSSGGIMAYRVGCELSSMVKGVGVQSGSLTLDSCENSNHVPLIHIHGSEDVIVPMTGGSGPDLYDFKSMSESLALFSAGGALVKPLIVDGADHSWRASSPETLVNFFD